ncbi:MAG: hypothetical protein CM15mP120_29880 [Pseudomonadota bacterium]|nr:MAG: hypothetical protein CM15mP120_29880 [Pseudomonadota bacterium]
MVYPIDRFKELETTGVIGSLASVHYSFMGAGSPPNNTNTARFNWPDA